MTRFTMIYTLPLSSSKRIRYLFLPDVRSDSLVKTGELGREKKWSTFGKLGLITLFFFFFHCVGLLVCLLACLFVLLFSYILPLSLPRI